MSIENRQGDLLKQPDINVIVHIANLYHTFGAGIAKQIADKYPEAFEADKKTPHGNNSKLGSFSFAKTDDGKTVINGYAMEGLGVGKRQTNYEAIYRILETIHDQVLDSKKALVVGIPKFLGCGLAGGDWKIVNAMIESIFLDSKVKLVIVEFLKS